ncbi:MAG: 4-hydroxy-tetrahydrodipicolinate synthase [Pseudomonadota bacterium]
MYFRGTIPALPTPFLDGALDLDGLRRIIEHVRAGGVDGLLACGTTGETPTLSAAEWRAVVEATVAAAGDLPVIVGTGTNSTASTVEQTRQAADLGAAGALVVVPYYNKPTQAGMLNHFELVAAASDLPIILYNIPGRTGVNMEPATVIALSRIPNIRGIKEASGSLDQASAIAAGADDGFSLLSGDDSLTLPLLAVGARGVISTSAAAAPALMTAVTAAWDAGLPEAALAAHRRLLPLFRQLFIEANPAPLKAALSMLGLCRDEVRPPLLAMSGHLRGHLAGILEDLGVLT